MFVWRSLLVLAAGAVAPAAAQQVREVGIQALFTASDPGLGVAGMYAAIRPSTRARIAATLGAGVSDGKAAGHGELLAHFLLNPTSRGHAGAYVGGGIAGVVGAVDRGYAVLILGIEERPGARRGWAFEAGVGGGVRIALGYRWRHLPQSWRGTT